MTQRLRVLLSAYACNPYKGSEDGVGWGWLRAIATHHAVHVVTAEFQREFIERWQGENPGAGAGIQFHYVRRRWFHYRPTRMWTHIESSLLKPAMNFAYAQWLRDGARLASALDEQFDFDLVHLVTYVGYRFPGRYWELGKPFVWGPVGGLENTPWRFLPSLGLSGCIYYAARNAVNSIQKRVLPSPKRAFRRARGGIIAATEGTRREIRHFYGEDSEVISEIGLPGQVSGHPTTRSEGETLRIAWSGEHLPGKALPFLLRALALLDTGIEWGLSVLGHGRCTKRWMALADRLGLDDRVRWTGWIDREAALGEMRSAQLFVITSLKDLTSTVLLEALSQGLPVVCPDHCGFSNVLTEDCGIKVPLRAPTQFTKGLAAAITALWADEDERSRLARGALERASHYTWDDKAGRIEAVHLHAVTSSGSGLRRVRGSDPVGARCRLGDCPE